MSTIKSSDEHLTLNADGSSKDIKFQANGVEKASIDSSGNLTVSGNLTSVGIDDNADATAITIDSSENVGIGTTSPVSTLEVAKSDQTNGAILSITNIASTSGWDTDDTIGTINFRTNDTSTSQPIRGQITSKVTETLSGGTFPSTSGMVFSVANGNTLSETLRLTSDGRGLSQFTAKAWCNFDGTGTPSFNDSHNCSSITDNGTGDYTINFTNNMANVNYSAVGGRSMDTGSGAYYISIDTLAVGSLKILSQHTNGSSYDSNPLMLIIFGD